MDAQTVRKSTPTNKYTQVVKVAHQKTTFMAFPEATETANNHLIDLIRIQLEKRVM